MPESDFIRSPQSVAKIFLFLYCTSTLEIMMIIESSSTSPSRVAGYSMQALIY